MALTTNQPRIPAAGNPIPVGKSPFSCLTERRWELGTARWPLVDLPQSAFGKAAAYTWNMWAKLERCLQYGHVELSNNLAENSMRPVALGRKNWLHVGSVKSGPKVEKGWFHCRYRQR